MSNRRVWEVARDLGVTIERLISDLCNLGLEITHHFSILDDETVELVLNLYHDKGTQVVSIPSPVKQTATPCEATQPTAANAKLPASPTTAGKVLQLPKIFTVNDCAEALRVDTEDVLAQLMHMGTVSSVNQVMDLDAANILAQKLGKDVILVAESEEDVGKDQVSGGIMNPFEAPQNTTDLPDKGSEASDTNAQESRASPPRTSVPGGSEASVPIDTMGGGSAIKPIYPEAEEPDTSEPTSNRVEEGKKFVVIDYGKANPKQIKKLRRGRGSLMRRASRVLTELKAEDVLAQDKSTFVMVIEVRDRRRD